MRPGCRLAPRLVQQIVLLGIWMPFERVPAALALFTGISVGRETARTLTEAAGRAAAALTVAEVTALQQRLPAPPTGPAVQYLSVDGAFVPLVDGEWAEVKTLALGTVMTDATGTPTTTDLSYFSRLADAVTFGELATAETWRRGTPTAQKVVAVTDGAAWIQGFIDLQRPDAIRILDFAHAVEHLAQAAQAVFGVGTPETSAWLGEQAHALRHGQEGQVLAALTGLAARPGLGAEAAQVVVQTVAYLTERDETIHYDAFAAAGYPIGSGCVESANKVVVEARLKGAGMHWTRTNVNPLLELRTLWANARWTERWPAIWTTLGLRPAPTPTSPAVPASAVGPPPPPRPPSPPQYLPRAKLVVDGHPTADHPWRHFIYGHAKR